MFQDKVKDLEKKEVEIEKRVKKDKHQEVLLMKREIDQLRKDNQKTKDEYQKKVS